MIECFLSVRVSFWLVGANRMPRRCAAILRPSGADEIRPLVSWKKRKLSNARQSSGHLYKKNKAAFPNRDSSSAQILLKIFWKGWKTNPNCELLKTNTDVCSNSSDWHHVSLLSELLLVLLEKFISSFPQIRKLRQANFFESESKWWEKDVSQLKTLNINLHFFWKIRINISVYTAVSEDKNHII